MNDYKDLYFEQKIKPNHLLIGNGFSISVWDKFSYNSLYENVEYEMDDIDRKLFKSFNTSNFEHIMEHLLNAIKINKKFNIDTTQLQDSYERIKSSLISSIISVHPDYENLYLQTNVKQNYCFRVFTDSVFTTNYDLIPYWLINELLSKQRRNVTDFFTRRPKGYLYFNPNKNLDGLKLFYLHGALHFYINHLGDVVKVENRHDYLIQSVVESIKKDRAPLYVSEGSYEGKLRQIENNHYLSFCYDSLKEIDGDLTIFGLDLSTDNDKHIIEAINASGIENIAYGIFDKSRQESIKESINDKFRDKTILFFNSGTFYDNVMHINSDIVLNT
ncbi:DUF4917 family protein [Siminovitchia terrae]|uniref:DUF4917 family protein n=1 Tax=Siminovitchia terrae TaxID=1914933 RepID=UPI00163CE841|nr:DUF4917 family protein [Siminovitchia terrae]